METIPVVLVLVVTGCVDGGARGPDELLPINLSVMSRASMAIHACHCNVLGGLPESWEAVAWPNAVALATLGEPPPTHKLFGKLLQAKRRARGYANALVKHLVAELAGRRGWHGDHLHNDRWRASVVLHRGRLAEWLEGPLLARGLLSPEGAEEERCKRKTLVQSFAKSHDNDERGDGDKQTLQHEISSLKTRGLS